MKEIRMKNLNSLYPSSMTSDDITEESSVFSVKEYKGVDYQNAGENNQERVKTIAIEQTITNKKIKK